ncbi:MAG: hypothetical protein RR719_00605 [Akkermansia sp.]
MRYLVLIPSLIVCFASCSKQPYVSQWNKPDSALEPVGFAARKQAMMDRAKEGKFKSGDKVTLRNAKTMVFEKNPQTHFVTTGNIKSGGSAVVLESDSIFIKVEFSDGTRGYINSSDIVDPSEGFGLLPVGIDGLQSPINCTGEMPDFLKPGAVLPDSSLETTPGNPSTTDVLPSKPEKPEGDTKIAPVPPVAPAIGEKKIEIPKPAPAPAISAIPATLPQEVKKEEPKKDVLPSKVEAPTPNLAPAPTPVAPAPEAKKDEPLPPSSLQTPLAK